VKEIEMPITLKKNISVLIVDDSAIVFGMPKEAIDCQAAEKIVPLLDIAQCMFNFARK